MGEMFFKKQKLIVRVIDLLAHWFLFDFALPMSLLKASNSATIWVNQVTLLDEGRHINTVRFPALI